MSEKNNSKFFQILTHLRSVGCTKREAEIYLDVLVNGGSTIQEISNRLGQNRVTIHSAVEQLLGKGIFSETRRDRRRLILAEEPEVFLRLLNRRQQELSIATNHAEQAIGLLKQLARETKSTPKLRLHHGADGFKQLLEESLSATTEMLVVTDIEKFSELLSKEYLVSYFKRRRNTSGSSARINLRRSLLVSEKIPLPNNCSTAL